MIYSVLENIFLFKDAEDILPLHFFIGETCLKN